MFNLLECHFLIIVPSIFTTHPYQSQWLLYLTIQVTCILLLTHPEYFLVDLSRFAISSTFIELNLIPSWVIIQFMWDISFDPKIMVGALCRSTYIFSPLMCNPVRSFSAYLYIWVNYNFLGTSILSIYFLTISLLPIRLSDLDCCVLYLLHMRIVSKSYLYYQYSN